MQCPDLNLRPSDFPISQKGRWMFYSFGHPNWFVLYVQKIGCYNKKITTKKETTSLLLDAPCLRVLRGAGQFTQLILKEAGSSELL